jgi:SpoVK/Ycf46/Vps4 family AAA+-type ATPase
MLLGYPEGRKCDKITRVFEDAHKSPRSIIILDNLERLLSYVPIGPRFSNDVLQTLLVLLKKTPPKGRKLLVIATTSALGVLESMDLAGAFSVSVRVPTLSVRTQNRSLSYAGPYDLTARERAEHRDCIGLPTTGLLRAGGCGELRCDLPRRHRWVHHAYA